jgi:hypothetical protein
MKETDLSYSAATTYATPTGVAGLSPRVAEASLLLAFFIGSLLLRLPFRAGSLVNWDSVNFALGTQAFDLAHHQPHPPGYIGYVLLGSALNYITGDPITSLTLLSAIAGALAAVLLFLLGSQFMPRSYAAITAVLFALSPVVWYYSEVPLTYAVEVALALAILWTGYKARASGSLRYLLVTTVTLVLLGAVRQSGAMLLLPLWVYIVWAFPWRVRRQMLAVLVIGNLAWLVPLLWMAGGPIAYLEEMVKLTGAVVTPVSVFTLNLWGLLRNVTFVVGGFLIGVNLALVPIIISYRRGFNPITRLIRQDRTFFLLWAVPALLIYLLIHTGQLGYILLVLPLGFLCVGTALASLIKKIPDPQRNEGGNGGWTRLRNLPVGLVAIGVLANVLAFFFLPGVIYTVASAEGTIVMDNLAVSASGDSKGMTKARARQYDLKRNDAHWQELISFVHRFDPETTAILAVPDGAGSYRQLSYYLTEYPVYGLGKDRRGNFGHLMTAQGGKETYTIDGLDTATWRLPLPATTQRLVIPDPGIFDHLEMQNLPNSKVTLYSGAEVVVVQVLPMTTLYTINKESDGETTGDKENAVPGYFLIRARTS